MDELLKRAKEGNKDAIEEIINSYYPLIVKESKRVFLKNRTFEDLVQIGVISIIKAIKLYDLSRGSASFPGYVLFSIKNGYITIIRSEAKYNDEISLNIPLYNAPDINIIESLIDENINIETEVLNSFVYDNLYSALDKLDTEERELINFLYFENNNPNLSKYARLKNKDYYYCSCLKKRAFIKLKYILKEKGLDGDR